MNKCIVWMLDGSKSEFETEMPAPGLNPAFLVIDVGPGMNSGNCIAINLSLVARFEFHVSKLQKAAAIPDILGKLAQ